MVVPIPIILLIRIPFLVRKLTISFPGVSNYRCITIIAIATIGRSLDVTKSLPEDIGLPCLGAQGWLGVAEALRDARVSRARDGPASLGPDRMSDTGTESTGETKGLCM